MTIRIKTAAALVLACALAPFAALADYPERPITMIVPWGAGGGTDATGRIIASLLEKELGQPVNVVNRTGGSGVVGHSAIANAAPDGYTIGVLTVEIGMMHWAGLTDLDYSGYDPIALFNSDPAGLQLRADSAWSSAQEALDAIRANPGEHKSAGSGHGSIWHLALGGLLMEAGIAPDAAPYVPAKGAAAALQELVAGGLDLATCSVVEASGLIEAGRVKSVAVMAEERLPAFPDVPTLKEATGLDWTMGTWRGIGAPKGLPDDAKAKLIAAMEAAYASAEFEEFMAARGFGMAWRGGEAFGAWMADSDAALGEVMKTVGLAR